MFPAGTQGGVQFHRISERQGSDAPGDQKAQQDENNLVPPPGTCHQPPGQTGEKQGERLLLGLLQHGKE